MFSTYNNALKKTLLDNDEKNEISSDLQTVIEIKSIVEVEDLDALEYALEDALKRPFFLIKLVPAVFFMGGSAILIVGTTTSPENHSDITLPIIGSGLI